MLFLILNSLTLLAQSDVSNYKVYFAEGTVLNKKILIIRQYEQAGQMFYLGVDPNNLETEVIAAKQVVLKPTTWQNMQFEYKDTPYIKVVQAAQKQSVSLQNAGISHGSSNEKGITLTIDLCPSQKPLDRIIFTTLISEFKNIEKPVSIGVCVTGRFMLTHSADINWLKELVASGDIAITWVNHSYNHRFNNKLPLKKNFLLEANTDLDFEILGTELAMRQHGLLPSVFFRFPGLVSNQKTANKMIGYGLVPIGSDAWLAKGQKVHSGSIVLIHGNGNEPVGVKDFIQLLQSEKASVMNKQWLIYDLRESIEHEFKE
jgi:hypothetical protein